MQFNLKVKVLKKSKDSLYPEHMIVERKSTHEMVHIYFDDGVLKRLIYIVRDPEIKMVLDEREGKYKTSLPNYTIKEDMVYQENEGRYIHLKESKNSLDFFGFSVGSNLRTLGFRSLPNALPDLYVHMDLAGKCIPNAYLRDTGVAEIAHIYPHQPRKVHPLSKLIAGGIIKSR